MYAMGVARDGSPYYAMRFLGGDNLANLIRKFHSENSDRRGGSFFETIAFRKLLNHFVAICSTVEYAHSRGVVHRDLKPANIMTGDYGETLVVDWGLAKVLGYPETQFNETTQSTLQKAVKNDLTEQGQVLGTIAYMAPEQASGDGAAIGPAADIYCLGGILYSLLTHRPPHDGYAAGSPVGVEARAAIVAPRTLDRRIPRPLAAICQKALQAEPQARYSSAQLLRQDVERWLANEPVLAYREGLVERLRRLARRHRAWTQAGIASLIALLLVLTISVTVINRARGVAESLAEEKSKLVVRVSNEAGKSQRLAVANGRLAERERQARKRSEFEALQANFLRASHSRTGGDSSQALLVLAQGVEQIHHLRAKETAGKAPAARQDRAQIVALADWEESFREHFAAAQNEIVLLRGGMHCGVLSPYAMRFSNSGSSLIVRLHECCQILDLDSGDEREVACDPAWGAAAAVGDGRALAFFSPAEKGLSPTKITLRRAGEDRVDWAEIEPIEVDAKEILAVSPCGARLLVTTPTEELSLWDLEARRPIWTLKRGRSPWVCAACSDQARTTVAATKNGVVTRIDAEGKAKAQSRAFKSVLKLHITPDGARAASIGVEGIDIWDLRVDRHSYVHATMNGTANCKLSPDGGTLAYWAGLDSKVTLLDTATNRSIGAPLQFNGRITRVVFSPDSRRVATMTMPTEPEIQPDPPKSIQIAATVWQLPGNRPGEFLATGKMNPVIAIAPGGELVATADGPIVSLHSQDPFETLPAVLRHDEPIANLKFEPSGQELVGIGISGLVRVWNCQTGKRVEGTIEKLPLSRQAPYYISPDTHFAAIRTSANVVTIFELRNAKTSTIELLPDDPPRSGTKQVTYLTSPPPIAISPDSRLLAAATKNGLVEIWDVLSGKRLGNRLGEPGATVNFLKFSPLGSRLLTANLSNVVQVWEISQGRSVGVFTTSALPMGDFFAAIGDRAPRVIVGSRTTGIAVWDLPSAEPLVSEAGFGDGVFSTGIPAFVETALVDEERVVVICAHGHLRIWDMRRMCSLEGWTDVDAGLTSDGEAAYRVFPKGEIVVRPTVVSCESDPADLIKWSEAATGRRLTSNQVASLLPLEAVLEQQAELRRAGHWPTLEPTKSWLIDRNKSTETEE